MRHSQCLCLPKTPSNGGPKPTTHFGYQLKRYAKKHPLSPSYANRRLCRTPGQGGRPGSPQPAAAVHSGLAAPEYAAREPIRVRAPTPRQRTRILAGAAAGGGRSQGRWTTTEMAGADGDGWSSLADGDGCGAAECRLPRFPVGDPEAEIGVVFRSPLLETVLAADSSE